MEKKWKKIFFWGEPYENHFEDNADRKARFIDTEYIGDNLVGWRR